jgi:hypothetical protein
MEPGLSVLPKDEVYRTNDLALCEDLETCLGEDGILERGKHAAVVALSSSRSRDSECLAVFGGLTVSVDDVEVVELSIRGPVPDCSCGIVRSGVGECGAVRDGYSVGGVGAGGGCLAINCKDCFAGCDVDLFGVGTGFNKNALGCGGGDAQC